MPEIIWNKESIEKATRGMVTEEFSATGIEFDSRLVQKGDLFLAFKGENTDGHNFLNHAFENGASAALVEQDIRSNNTMIKVADSFDAIRKMAKYKRQIVAATYLAVTGSLGKTTTKELLNAALTEIAPTHCSKANNNNILGLSINLARMPNSTKYAILELGMDKTGELLELSNFLQPNIAIITTVEGVHRAQFNSVDDIAKAKSEIFAGVTKGGTIVLNKDNRYFDFLKSLARDFNIISFGEDQTADVSLIAYNFDENQVTANVKGLEVKYKLSICGKHHALNSLAVLAALVPLNIDIEKAANGMQNVHASFGRGGVKQVSYHGKNLTIIDDSYNAHPVSMSAAIENLGKKKHAGRKIAILADMLELGPEEELLHANMTKVIERSNLNGVITVGKLMQHLNKALPSNINLAHFASPESLQSELDNYLKTDDLILFKGSNGSKLHKIVKLIVNS